MAGLSIRKFAAGQQSVCPARLDRPKEAKPLRELAEAWLERREARHRYEAGRHTFASHWVLTGGSAEMLREILGHSTVKVTERYAHLRPDLFPPHELARANFDPLATRSSR